MLNDQRNKKEEIKFDLQQKLTHAKYDIDNATENAKIFDEVIQERRRFLKGSYLMKGQDDLEQILDTLHDHFKLIKLTAFEEHARNN